MIAATRNRMLTQRHPPVQPSSASITAIVEAAEALAELRALEAPAAQRGPRAEGDELPSVSVAGPSAASDAAHLAWQLRRVLLFDRRRRWALGPDARDGPKREAAMCNVVCGAALAQSAVDVRPPHNAGDGASDPPAHVAQILASLSLPTKRYGRGIRTLIDCCRGHAPPPRLTVPQQAIGPADLTAPTAAAAAALANMPPAPPVRTDAEFAALIETNAIYVGFTNTKLRRGYGNTDSTSDEMVAFLRELPHSLWTQPPFAMAKLQTRGVKVKRLSQIAKNVVSSALSAVRAVCHLICFRNAYVLFVTTVHGRPLAVLNGLQTSSRAIALQRLCRDNDCFGPFDGLKPATIAVLAEDGFTAADAAVDPCYVLVPSSGRDRELLSESGMDHVVRPLSELLSDLQQVDLGPRETMPGPRCTGHAYLWIRMLIHMVARLVDTKPVALMR